MLRIVWKDKRCHWFRLRNCFLSIVTGFISLCPIEVISRMLRGLLRQLPILQTLSYITASIKHKQQERHRRLYSDARTMSPGMRDNLKHGSCWNFKKRRDVCQTVPLKWQYCQCFGLAPPGPKGRDKMVRLEVSLSLDEDSTLSFRLRWIWNNGSCLLKERWKSLWVC